MNITQSKKLHEISLILVSREKTVHFISIIRDLTLYEVPMCAHVEYILFFFVFD